MSKHHRRSGTVAPAAPTEVQTSRARPVEFVGSTGDADRVHHNGVSLEDAIRVRAYQNWERAGRPEGDGVAFWLEAEAELKGTPAS